MRPAHKTDMRAKLPIHQAPTNANHTPLSGDRENIIGRSLVPSKRKESSTKSQEMSPHNRQLSYSSASSSSTDRGGPSRKPWKSTPELIAELEDKLTTYMLESVFEGTEAQFLPQNLLDTMLSRSASERDSEDNRIEHVLRLLNVNVDRVSEDDKSLANFILGGATKLFLITVFIRLHDLYAAMALFKIAGLTDENLPIEEWPLKEGTQQLDEMKHPLVILERRYTSDTKCMWTVYSIRQFKNAQMKFLAPVITTGVKKNNNFGHLPMPFIACSTIPSSGAHGIVRQYTIHPAHVRFDYAKNGVTPCVVAVKAFRQSGEKGAPDWGREVTALESVNELNNGHAHIVRFLIAFTRGRREDPRYYVMFEWADGGNLGSFWKAHHSPVLSASLIKWVIVQLHGLADALTEAHAVNTRHGDLKPANILWFRGGSDHGTLKLGDWGEAKGHVLVTALRHDTTAKWGTRRYEPPETGLQVSRSRSRLYDIWSTGCIAFEFIVWLLYGFTGLESFNGSNYGAFGSFYEPDHDRHTAKIHPMVSKWMEHMNKDALCRPDEMAIGDLLEIVRTGLLVVKTPKKNDSESDDGSSTATVPRIVVESDSSHIPSVRGQTTDQNERITAKELRRRLQNILHARKKDDYWQPTQKARPAPVESTQSGHLSAPSTARTLQPRSSSLHTPGSNKTESDYGNVTLDPAAWYFPLDNDFAATLLTQLEIAKTIPPRKCATSAKTCKDCRINFERLVYLTLFASFDTKVLEQNTNAQTCDLCRLLWLAYQPKRQIGLDTVQVYRDLSTIKMSQPRMKTPVLMLFRDADSAAEDRDIQIGLPELPDPGTSLHFRLIQGWIDDCELKHRDPACRPLTEPPRTRSQLKALPTRLIDVGNHRENVVKLREMGPGDSGEWIALSYRWGNLAPFCTTLENLDNHIEGMTLDRLPQTFRDAIKVTRALGQKFLWIDSICIIQGEHGDFKTESERMEDVYSGAYCVLAASCATDQTSGFLLPRQKRDYVSTNLSGRKDSNIYICSRIEDFRDDVQHGALNKRGWVLQEHALARRTVFFTERQTYWECGHGVRCETMAKMTNQSAALLGDPDFPKILAPAQRGERILRFQELYQDYSRLQLSSDCDRPIAIRSLEQRLLRTMRVDGDWGVLESCNSKGLLRRSLLWHRGEDTACLTPIKFPKNRDKPPSWSWMSVSGSINYLSPNWNGYDWQDIQSPWPVQRCVSDRNALTVEAHRLDLSVSEQDDCKIIFDDSTYSELLSLKAVVLGIEKVFGTSKEGRHYILVIRPHTDGEPGSDKAERIGAGYVLARYLKGEVTKYILV